MSGYKSYIVAALMAFVTVAHSMGWIDDATRDTLSGILLGGGIAALRAGINKRPSGERPEEG